MQNAITNRYLSLYDTLKIDFADAIRIRLMVSFVMEKGVALVINDLINAATRMQAKDENAKIQLLASTYMGVTEPSALYMLRRSLGEMLDLRIYNRNDTSFHTKAYLIDTHSEHVVYVGSSNLSREALTKGVEWNFRLQRSLAPHDYEHFSMTFDDYFNNFSDIASDELLQKYAASWRKVQFVNFEPDPVQHQSADEAKIQARGFQIEALYALEQARAEGVSKALVTAATGTGKTYLAALDSYRSEFKRVLFVAHRDEILQQAEDSFRKTRADGSYGRLGNGRQDTAREIIFANVQTLFQERYLTDDVFSPECFDYIIVDEFHHAAAASYKKVLQYFKPKFLLGLTATPFRTDNQDIFGLCDGNVVYEIFLTDAINRGLLAPFRYYGFYDETDYSAVKYRNGRYDLEHLERVLTQNKRADLVLSKYKQFATKRALGFCAGIKHAEFMASYFSKHGVAAAVCHSGVSTSAYYMERSVALEKLKNREIKIVFSVDLFNEGLDVPSLDMVLFLRPTESFVVFLQQLGRGLRKDGQKKYLDVLDFIGNYKRAHFLPLILSGKNPWTIEGKKHGNIHEIKYPDDCQVNFDFRIIDLFIEMRKREPIKERMLDEYLHLKEQLGVRPSRRDMYNGVDVPLDNYLRPDGWLCFLGSVGELTGEEKTWVGTPAALFLRELEKTSMVKSYKMPTIQAFLDNETILPETSAEKVVARWREYYSDPVRDMDMLRDKSTIYWREWNDEKLYRLVERNPIHFLSLSNRFFHYDQINKRFKIHADIHPYLSNSLADHVRDIIEWRTEFYFARRYTSSKGDTR